MSRPRRSRSTGGEVYFAAGGLELDVWRFRLPAATMPEMATSGYTDGELAVEVLKDASYEGEHKLGDVCQHILEDKIGALHVINRVERKHIVDLLFDGVE
ncbi:hypothetical protein RHGRI_003609 [Rhododendron griersonianum]|uniref:Uncharacterized protein n=1 Tax=Rhododendron griersonianum TaxID=479676 RepID=A0AAV6L6P6_9ERIC|nr:hypothetical protein RHGRI_003609 [Rhododendron griersonianum]